MSLSMTKVANRRSSYDERTKRNGRAASTILAVINEKPEFFQDAEGNLIRVWKKEELLKWTFDELTAALRGVSVFEPEELLGDIPPSAIKYSVNKGWVFKSAAGWLQVTEKGARELDLPRSIRGKTIRFYKG